MKTTLSFTALALLATALILPMQASAADRQISINPKVKTFSVQTTPEVQAEDVAEAAPSEPQKKVVPKFFRVNDQPTATEVASSEDPKPPTKRVKTQEFRVDDTSEQAAAAPTQDEADDVATTETDRPANQLNEKVKLVKKVPAQIEDTSSEEATADTSDETDDEQVAEVKRPIIEDTSSTYEDAGYEQGYRGSSCHNENNGY
jgi:hypothetical protein